MDDTPETLFNPADFIPDLQDLFRDPPLDTRKIVLAALQVKDSGESGLLVPAGGDRQSITLASGKDVWFWEADSLRALFRGDKQPPILGDYPEAYNDTFALFDMHVVEFSAAFGDPRDAELEEIFSTLRRRPDGRSMGFLHDYLWQAAALVLGTRPLSQAEFEAIMRRLERSCRTFEQGPTSRNFATSIRRLFETD